MSWKQAKYITTKVTLAKRHMQHAYAVAYATCICCFDANLQDFSNTYEATQLHQLQAKLRDSAI